MTAGLYGRNYDYDTRRYVKGMRLAGVPVTDLLAAYHKQRP